ncbi:MAG: thioredoxin fold domain-containing protein [Desulfobulbaceae bacterium]|nr:MAG: thioredoxin fold domain-containing protein [Desulfobulbaceae bacterium]
MNYTFRSFPLMIFLAGCLLIISAMPAAAAENTSVPAIPVPGMVTMVDLGARKCIPCKMMAPILEELAKEYKDRAAIVFIDVWENPQEGPKFGIQLIPTQIFYDARGKEVLRHEGFMEKTAIVAQLEKLGVR